MRARLNGLLFDAKKELERLEVNLGATSGQPTASVGSRPIVRDGGHSAAPDRVVIVPSELQTAVEDLIPGESPGTQPDRGEQPMPTPPAQPGSMLEIKIIPTGFAEFLKVASSGDLKAVICLAAAVIFEFLIFYFVKRKQQQEQLEW